MDIRTYLDTRPTLTPVVVGFLIRNDEVLLGERKKVSLGLGHHLISGIGGKVGDEISGESHDHALVRELQEETGVTPVTYHQVAHLTFLFPHKPNWSQQGYAYLVTRWDGMPIETEAIRPVWYPIAKLPSSRMWDDNHYWLPRVLAGETLTAVFLFDDQSRVIEKQIRVQGTMTTLVRS